MDPSSGHVLGKVDMKKALNSISHDQVLNQLRIRYPVLHSMDWQAYGKPSPLYIGDDVILSSTGVQQGDPIGQTLFALEIDSMAHTPSHQSSTSGTSTTPPSLVPPKLSPQTFVCS